MATWATADTKPSYNFSEIGGSVDVTKQLSGKIPEANLPSYVDDVLEYNSKSNFPTSGETGKIYVDISTNLTYRWGGSAYVEISPSLALGETSGTAYRGDYGAIAYAHSQKRSGNPHGVTKSDVGLGNVENKSSAEIRNDITQDNVTTALGYTPANQTDLNTLSSQIPTTYAGSKSAGGPANSALKVRDYGKTGFTINIGYQGNALNADEIKSIAAYARKGGEILIKDAPASAVISFLSAVTQTELEDKGYITSSELDGKGYITSTYLNNNGYVTQYDLSSSLTGYVPTGRTVNGKKLSQDITIDSVASATTSKSATTASSASSVAWSNVKNAPSFASSDHTHSEYVKKTGDTMSGTLYIDNSNSTALTCTGKTEFEGDVTVTGKVSASSGFFQTSDRRLKNFQGDIEVDFDKLKSIPKKYFYWNMDSKKSKLEIGTSAQEVMEVYPELVSINEAGMLSVAYDKLSVIALKAVDELHEENVALKEKNDELERRLKAIEEKLGI